MMLGHIRLHSIMYYMISVHRLHGNTMYYMKRDSENTSYMALHDTCITLQVTWNYITWITWNYMGYIELHGYMELHGLHGIT